MAANPAVQRAESYRADEVFATAEILLRSISFPLTLRLPKPLNNDQLLEFCAANDLFRIERNPAGEVILMTPAGGKNGKGELYIGRELDNWVELHLGLAFGPNTGFSLPDGSVRAPDAAWLSSEKWNSLTSAEQEKFIPFCPELIVELRSPNDSLTELEQKMDDWIANGAQLAWLIDPLRKLAMIYRPGQEPETLLQPELLHGEGPIAGFTLKMQRPWD
ncbi:MAG: Uma2 family endonuclease [Acidobacteriota bacterium]